MEDKGESVIIVVVCMCLLTGITVQSEDQNLIPFQKQVSWSTVPLGDVSLNELMYLLHHFVGMLPCTIYKWSEWSNS